MNIVKTVADLRAAVARARGEGKRIEVLFEQRNDVRIGAKSDNFPFIGRAAFSNRAFQIADGVIGRTQFAGKWSKGVAS